MTVAQKIRSAVAGKNVVRKITGQQLEVVTLSVGVPELKVGETPDEFARRADAAMRLVNDGPVTIWYDTNGK